MFFVLRRSTGRDGVFVIDADLRCPFGGFMTTFRHLALTAIIGTVSITGLFAAISPQDRRAAEAGDSWAQLALGIDGVKRGDGAEAARWLRASAEQGNADAQLFLGLQLKSGAVIAKDLDEAERWLKKAAAGGEKMATDALARLEEERTSGVAVGSEGELEAAAQKGDANAAYSLGMIFCFNRGDGVAGARWLKVAAEKGHAKAQGRLGFVCAAGYKGAPRDLAAAESWYRRAAQQGDRESCRNLAQLLLRPEADGEKQAEGVRWARRAADLGDADAMGQLGTSYLLGRGLKEDPVEGLAWLILAAEAGCREATAARDLCVEKLGAVRAEMAKNRSRALKAELEEAKARLDRPADAAAK